MVIEKLKKTPKYKERQDVRATVDVAVGRIEESTMDAEIVEVLEGLKVALKPMLKTGELSATDLRGVKGEIERLNLQPSEKEKLKEMFGRYGEAVETARELDPTVRIKSIDEVYEGFSNLGFERVKEILNMNRPTLLITPKNSFEEKIAKINANKKCENQADTYVNKEANSPYASVNTPSRAVISIVDGAVEMPHITGIVSNTRWNERKRLFKEHYARRQMKLINAHEYAMLMQMSLREYKTSGNDASRIVDGGSSVTCLDDTYLTKSVLVACGFFNPGAREVRFAANSPAADDAYLRGRPSVQVLEY